MGIQVFKPKFDIDSCLDEIRECLAAGWPGMGYKTTAFEEEWKKYTGHPNAYYTNSGSAAVHLAVKVLKHQENWQEGDEVISTPLTFVATNHAALYEGLKVVFADVDQYMCLDPESVEERITPKTRAVIFVGYGGRIGQLFRIMEICKKYRLKLILDAAHMAGTRVNGIIAGTISGIDVTAYSFHAVKNLSTGDSGMVCFRDPEADREVRKIAWLGVDKDTFSRNAAGKYSWQYDVEYLGYKYNGNSVMASLALVQLRHLDDENARRREIGKLYDEAFRQMDYIEIVPTPYPDEASYHIYAILVTDRDKLLEYLAEHGIGCSVHYKDNTEYKLYSYAADTCPRASAASKKLLTLPMHMYLSNEDVFEVTEHIKRYFEEVLKNGI